MQILNGFFDNVNQMQLLEFIKLRIHDKHFIRYIKKFLTAGVIENGSLTHQQYGTPQGSIISPVLSNVYLHYVLDDWFETTIKPHYHNCKLIRYCDDFVVLFTDQAESKQFYEMLQSRLFVFNLELEQNKTKIVTFNSANTPSNNLSFLGFNIAYDTQGTISAKTSLTKSVQKEEHILNLINNCINTDKDLDKLIVNLNQYLRGIYLYYGISTNIEWIESINLFAKQQIVNTFKHLYNVYDYIGKIIDIPNVHRLLKL